jgi:DNA helicase-2/ATP-dependent DNA helicase PcrA
MNSLGEADVPAGDNAGAAPKAVNANKLSLADFIKEVCEKTGLNEFHQAQDEIAGTQKLANLEELINSAVQYPLCRKGLLDFLDSINLDRSTLGEEEDGSLQDRVTLITLHNTKGLEFPRVIITGMEAGVFPREDKSGDDLEEERRLAYVALTRAENVLFLSDAEDGVGEESSRYPSRFLLEMDMADLHVVRGVSEKLLQEARAYIAESDRNRELFSDETLGLVKRAPAAEFTVGDRVFHRIMGFGTVAKVDEQALCYQIKFDKIETPRAIQFDFPLKRVME